LIAAALDFYYAPEKAKAIAGLANGYHASMAHAHFAKQ
jgi:hypothetical protein